MSFGPAQCHSYLFPYGNLEIEVFLPEIQGGPGVLAATVRPGSLAAASWGSEGARRTDRAQGNWAFRRGPGGIRKASGLREAQTLPQALRLRSGARGKPRADPHATTWSEVRRRRGSLLAWAEEGPSAEQVRPRNPWSTREAVSAPWPGLSALCRGRRPGSALWPTGLGVGEQIGCFLKPPVGPEVRERPSVSSLADPRSGRWRGLD